MAERRKLTTNPLSSTEGVALQVDDVYVPLGLVERKKPSKRQGDVSPEQGSELYKETEITKTFEHDAFLEEVLKHKNTPKSKGKRIAVIGEPGAGKTTLLQQIADWVSREIHQSIVIWVSLADLRGKELKTYLFETWLTQVSEKIGKAEATKQLKDDFVALFNRNNVWLLLDGLDEMSTSSGNPLTEIARQFREAGLISQARIVLTCRVNLWDGSINALDDFDTYRTLDFSYPEQVERFIHKWFSAIPEKGNQLCSDLQEPGKERIQDLVKNPLRLTLLCLNWQSGDGKLPDTQAGLYQQFVDDFYKWKKDEFATTSGQRQKLNIKLGELAKAAIDKEATRFRLRQDFVNQFLGDVDDENSLLKLALNRGWLNSIGIDEQRKPVYAFFHASFQEYFAAKAIDDWHFFLNHVPKNPSQGTYRIFELQWKQTILLWLGREEEKLKQQKQELIDALVNFKDGCGKWNRKRFYEYQAYFLAAAGIAEFRAYSRSPEIVEQIVNWATGYLKIVFFNKKIYLPFHYPIAEEANLALQQTDRTEAIAALVRMLQSNNLDDDTRWLNLDDFTRREAASSLGEIGTGNEIAIAALVQLLQSNHLNNSTRKQAVSSVEKIGTGNEIAIAALVQLLQSTNLDDDTRREAALSVEKIGTGNKIAIAALMQLLKSTNLDDDTRWRAASSLEKIGTGNEIAITALVQLLQSTNLDDFTRWRAASSLGKIDPGNEIAILALVQLLQSTNLGDDTRWRAASSLEKIGTGNEIAILALVQLLQSTNLDDFTRREAASSLGKIGTGNEIAILALVQLLQSTNLDDFTRREAASSLGEIDPGNEIAILALVQLLQSTNLDDFTRWRAASSLGKIGTGNEIAILALVQLLQSTNLGDDTRREAASSLGKIGTGNEIAILALVQLLQSTNLDDFTRREAASSLGEIGTGNEIAILALVQLLQSTNLGDDTRWRAASSLEKIGTGNEIAILALVQLLQSTNLDDFTRREAASSLGEIGTGNEIAILALVQLLQSTNLGDDTRWRAASSLEKIGTGNEIAITALVQLLQSTNLDDDTRWRAASSLEKIDPGNEIAILALVQLLQSTNLGDDTRWRAASSLEKIGTGNEIAIAALVQLLLTNLYDYTSWLAAYSLGRIGTGNKFAIAALVQLLLSNHLHDYIRQVAAISLGEIDPGNEIAIAALVQLLQSTTVDDDIRLQAANSLGEIINNQHRVDVVKALSGYWQLNDQYYDLAWKCAQNMPYPDFYQAWHQHNFVTRALQTLKKILLTRI